MTEFPPPRVWYEWKTVFNRKTGKNERVCVKRASARWAKGATRRLEDLGLTTKPPAKGRYK